jgi:hypothetical protein
LRDLGDAIEHQHRRRRQLGIARTKELTARARDQLLERERRRKLHRKTCDQKKDDSAC